MKRFAFKEIFSCITQVSFSFEKLDLTKSLIFHDNTYAKRKKLSVTFLEKFIKWNTIRRIRSSKLEVRF